VGEPGQLWLDLKPDLSEAQVLARCREGKENLSPIRAVKKRLGLCEASLALLFHHTPKDLLAELPRLAARIKRFPIEFLKSQPLDEAISSDGGVSLEELDADFCLKKHPGVYLAGEMLDWDAPTGGWLIQGCVSQGRRAGKGILKYLNQQI
jgi:predicted flavoprotein YhiN